MYREISETPPALKLHPFCELAAAIRQGCRFTKKLRGHFQMRLLDGGIGACAIGAALWAHGHYLLGDEDIDEFAIFPVLGERLPATSVPSAYHKTLGFSGPADLSDVIVILNDDLKWSRKRIADWVESLA